MPTQIISQIVVSDKDQEPIQFYVSGDKKNVVIMNQADDARAFGIIIKKEDWNKIVKFIESKLK